ncbi:hypothetical protein BJY00DRAFT_56367 [Aspergillus carlsbadensis]|nr:hypothetical protein BJY00DRAFT_56367 [Aspergillus carlsbadensis]
MHPPKEVLKELAFGVVVCMAQFMTQAGLCMLIAPMYLIGNSFQTSSAGETSRLAAAYSLTVGTFILVADRLGGVFGHRLMFIIEFLWFGLWSLLAGFSVWSGQDFFDCCRGLQGIGPAISTKFACDLRPFVPTQDAHLQLLRRHCPEWAYSWCRILFNICPNGMVAMGVLGNGYGLLRLRGPWGVTHSSHSKTALRR